MSTLQQSSDANLESSADCENGGGHRRSVAVVGGGGEVQLANAIEMVNNHKEESMQSSVSECRVEIVDLEAGAPKTKLHLGETQTENERDCRICHLSMDATNQDSGLPIELGCSCKDDLAAAHKQCAEAWFKIKGDKTCEICGSVAENVAGVGEAELAESWNEASGGGGGGATTSSSASGQPLYFWQGHRFLNFLLACMVFAFVISWLFHFNGF